MKYSVSNLLQPVSVAAVAAPNVEAVEDIAGRWTYRTLMQRTSGVAAHLLERSVRPGDRVVILAGKDRHVVAALLGCWAVRATVVLPDETWSIELLVSVIERTAPTHALVADSFDEFSSEAVAVVRSMVSTSDVAAIPAAPMEACEWPEGRADDLAFLGFTSGTTGRPKIIAMSHGAYADSLHRHIADFGFDRYDRVAVHSVFAFDPALVDVLSALWCGGAAILTSSGSFWEGREWRDLLVRRRVTSLQCVPSALEIGLEGLPHGEAFAPLRRLILTGDRVSSRLMRLAAACLADGTEVYNAYGLTECPYVAGGRIVPSNHATASRFEWTRDDVRFVPDGLGRRLRLHVRGSVLFAGYWAQETGPVLPVDADGWFDTGDLFEDAAEGLQHRGRADRRLNWCGWRLEAAEIEGAVLSVAGVRSARVSHEADDRLVCEVDGNDVDEASVRAALERALPRVVASGLLLRKATATIAAAVERKLR